VTRHDHDERSPRQHRPDRVEQKRLFSLAGAREQQHAPVAVSLAEVLRESSAASVGVVSNFMLPVTSTSFTPRSRRRAASASPWAAATVRFPNASRASDAMRA